MSSNTSAVSDGNWHMVTMTYNGSVRDIYVDGQLDSSQPTTGTIAATGAMMLFGARQEARSGAIDNFFSGSLDDIYFYSRALSGAEVTQLYTTIGSSNTTTNLLPVSTALSVAAGSSLDLNGVSQQVASLGDATPGSGGTVTNSGASVVTLSVSGNANTTFSGVLSDGTGGLALTKNGTGTLTLAGNSTYSGATSIVNGRLNINGSLAMPASPSAAARPWAAPASSPARSRSPAARPPPTRAASTSSMAPSAPSRSPILAPPSPWAAAPVAPYSTSKSAPTAPINWR